MIDLNPNNNRNHTPEEGMYGCFGYVVGAILALVICAFMSCGSPKVITDTIAVHDTTYITKVQRDSIYQHDSVYVHEYTKGDTVHVDRVRWMVSYRDRLAHDTLYIHKTDTIARTVVEKVEKKLTWWQQLKIHLGGICFWLIIIAMALFILKRWYK